MSNHRFFLRWMSLSLATVLGVAAAAAVQPQALGGEAARLDGFTQDGNNVFALSLKPSVAAANGPRDVVVLVSTAASQTGDYRTRSLATLQAFLSSLGAGNRVAIVAFDLNAVPLTQGLVAPNSPEMAAAVAALNRRTPLGSCDLQKALETAIKSFSGDSKLPRAIVYIGDGSSRANILTADQVDGMINELVAQRTPVISFGVGPHIQEQMLGILASRTGGIVVPEQANVDAGASGTGLAYAVEGSVYWPKAGAMKWPDGMEVYPRNLPPFRSDRDTTVIGLTKSTAASHVDIDVEGPGGPQKFSFDIPEFKSDPANAYLVSLLDQAKTDGGRTLPLIDSASLANAKKEIAAGAGGLSSLASRALEDGNLANADKLAGEALKRNPNDLAAQAVKDAVAKKANGAPALVGPGVVAKDVAAPAAADGDLNLQGGNGGGPVEGAAAAADIGQASALEERWQKDVQNTINKARGQVTVDPNAAEAMVQNKTNDLTAETELRPEVRDRLMGMLHAAGREIKHSKEEFIFREQQRIHEEMARREQEMTNEAFVQDQTKVKQLMERYDSLIAEGRHRLAEESAAFEATKIVNRSQPDAKSMIVEATLDARLLGTYSDIMAVRVAKEKGFVDAMFCTEKSHVPTADDPPIVYPDTETWKELTARRKEKYSATELSRRSPTEKKIEEALKQPTQIEFVETPLKDVVDYLKDLHHIEIQLDGPALKEAGVDESTPVTKNLKGISLRSALKLLLDELQLKYVVHNEVLLITSPAKAESDEYMTTKVYPVADLVLPIKDAGFAGGFGGMGGMGGFGGQGGQGGAFGGNGAGFGGGMMGGMGGGGMMGGGMGGMGGMGMGMGGGGMMGGGMGGGMFNVPREILPAGRQPAKLFAVEPESVAKEPSAVSNEPVAARVRTPDAVPAIKLNLAPGADVTAAWEEFFAKHEPEKDLAKVKAMSLDEKRAYQARLLEQQMSVLKTVQELKDAAAAAVNRGKKDEAAKKHEEIAALIQAALRHDQAQPWMYEILAMSMKAAGQSQEEIDRAIMSAAEFSQSSTDLMYLGAYLVQSKMDRRALQVFRQVSQAEPLWPEPYYSGMLAARRLQDVAGLEWSTAGIIGQAWSPAQAHIWEDAYRVAQATLKDLRDNKRNEEADHFQTVLNDAMARDCVVKVQWTGDADIDLMVKEPAGTVCSLRNQRTTGGGVMIGDMSSESAASVEGHVAVYTCPKAFSGGYQILLRRVFGKLTTGKVTVEVITHLNTSMVKSLKQVIPLGNSEALVKFDVADGRRKESIQEQQVVNAAVAAVAQRNVQNILAQQLANLNDPAAANALGAAQQAAASSSAGQSQQLNPLAFPTIWPGSIRGAVGYQPVIITLPTGTNLAATAVVSADRRYVRITSVPLFSAISNVTTFNIASGSTNNTTTAYGGGAGGGIGSNPGNGAVGGGAGAGGGGVF